MTTETPTFTRGPARRPAVQVADPALQWSTGLPTNDRRIYAGWLCEQGKNSTLDDAMQKAGVKSVTIRHGQGNLVTHWAVETAKLFVVAEGVQSIAEMQHTTERFGVAFGWRTLQGGRQQSQIRFRAFLTNLVEAGYVEPLLVTAKGTLTGDIITALTHQYQVLDALDALCVSLGKAPMHAPFYAIALPLGPGREVTRGSEGHQKEIVPVVAKLPALNKGFYKAHWIPKSLAQQIEDMLDTTLRWSVEQSARIAAGEQH